MIFKGPLGRFFLKKKQHFILGTFSPDTYVRFKDEIKVTPK